LIFAAVTFERIINNIMNYLAFGTPPVLFIVFLILFIVNMVKLKKGKGKKGKTIAFGVLSAVFLTYTLGEVFIIGFLAAAISHM